MADHTNLILKETFVVVTGASRGLGKAIALQFASKLPSSSLIVLLARDIEALDRVKKDLKNASPEIDVLVRQYDQGNVDDIDYFNSIFDDMLKENNLSKDAFEQYMIVHNCATTGDVSKTALEMDDCISIREYYDINLTGMILLNTSFFQTFSDSTKSRVIINMTSAASKNPTPSLSLYCAGKAARDMFFRVLAAEEPSIRILSSAPSTCDTDMITYTEENSASPLISALFMGLRQEGKLYSTHESINGLVKLLEENTFDDACYVDAVPDRCPAYLEKLNREKAAEK